MGYNAVADNTGSIFIRLTVVASQICKIPQILRKFELITVQGHPRLSILVGQCRDLFFSRWRRLSSSRSWTTTIRHSPAFHRMSCHGCSQWWTPPLNSSFPRQSSNTSLRSYVNCTGWKLKSGLQLHSNKQCSCTSVYSVSQKNPPLEFSKNFSQTVGNF